jgi:hypothetical protein
MISIDGVLDLSTVFRDSTGHAPLDRHGTKALQVKKR